MIPHNILKQMKKDKNINNFLNKSLKKLKENNIPIHLSFNKKEVVDNYFDGGFFSKDKFACFANCRFNYWLSIYVHEYCHFLQYLDNNVDKNDEFFITIEDWINGKKINIKKIQKSIDYIQKIELDCEKRSIKLIKKYKLPINIETYCQKSNSYIFFYNYCYLRKQWIDYGDQPPYKLPKIYQLFPKHLLNDFSKINKKIIYEYDKVYF